MESTQIQALYEPPLAAMPQLSEKPRQGFETWKTAWNQGSNSCNFTVTLGLQATVVENGVRETYSARYYNPMTGRFLSRDPLEGQSDGPASLHKYRYADGDPVDLSDPTGRATAAPLPFDPDPTPGPLAPVIPFPSKPNPSSPPKGQKSFITTEYAMILGTVSITAAAALPKFRKEIECLYQETESGLEYAQLSITIQGYNWILSQKPPGGFGDKGPDLPPNLPPNGTPSPNGNLVCGKCNCAIRCSARIQSGAGAGGYETLDRKWVLGRADSTRSCIDNAQSNFNQSLPNDSGITAGHCNADPSGAILGKWCN